MWPVSCIVPCYNEPADRIAQTVQSAVRAMAGEVIVIDDGSAVPPEVPRLPQVYVYSQEHKGIAAALNEGVRRASNGWIAQLSVGDTWLPQKVAEQWCAMDELDADASFHDYLDGVTNEACIAIPDWRKRMWRDNQFCQSTAMLTRDAVWRAGGWDEDLDYCVDWKFALAVEHFVGWCYIPGVYGTAGEYPGGHTDRASAGMLWREKCRQRTTVSRWARKHEKLLRGEIAA